MWRPGLLLREAYRNLGPRALVLGLAVATVLAIVGVATALMAISVLSQQEGQLERGAAVWWVESDADGAPVPARVCAELQGSPGVAGAGAVGREQVEWRAFPSARGVTIDVATPGLWAAWGAPRLTAGVVAGSDLVDTGLVGVGSILYDGGGQAHRIEARTPASVKTSRLLANVVVTRPPDFDMSECWVRMEPGSISAGPDLLAFAFADYSVGISPFVADDTALLSPQEQWEAYAALAPGLVAGVLIGLLVALTNWGRRSEFAVYRTFGTATSQLMFLVLAELALLLLPAVAIAGGMTVAAFAFTLSNSGMPLVGLTDAAGAALVAMTSAALTGWALGGASVAIVSRGGLHDQLKDR